jgi:hypothetical protein
VIIDPELLELGLVEGTASKAKGRRTDFTARDIARIQGFGRVTFLPESWDKRFTDEMQRLLEGHSDAGITDAQRAQVRRIARKYRRQMPRRVDADYPDLIETFAIRAALGNNGGTWAEHYTEAQKEHWRQFIRDMIVHIKIGLANDDSAS